jgi:hypothetical protein
MFNKRGRGREKKRPKKAKKRGVDGFPFLRLWILKVKTNNIETSSVLVEDDNKETFIVRKENDSSP